MRFHPVSQIRSRAFDLVNIHDAASVLLVGVGTGVDLEFLNPSSLIVAADISIPMLRHSRKKAQQLNIPIVSVCSDASQLPCGDDSFEVVVLMLLVSVVPDPQACLTESLRVLRPGGRIMVLDKFVPTGQRPSIPRRFLNLLIRPFGTDINRRWEDISSELGPALSDEATTPGSSIRAIVVQKPGKPQDYSMPR